MSLKSEANKTAQYLRSSRKAILGRGGEISPTAGLKDLPSAIYNIPADTSLAFQTDDSAAYEKLVPKNAEEYAYIKSIGGMTYKSNNIIPFTYTETVTSGGITFTPQDDGSVKVEGTSTSQYIYFRLCEAIPFTQDVAFSISGDIDTSTIRLFTRRYDENMNSLGDLSTSSTTKTAYLKVADNPNVKYVEFRLWVCVADTTFSGTVYPMANYGSKVLPYEPYYEGLRDTKVTVLESEGANIIPFPYFTKSSTTNGVTYTVGEDGGITFDGECTAGFQLFLWRKTTIPMRLNGTYSASMGDILPNNCSLYFAADVNYKLVGGNSESVSVEVSNIDCVYIAMWIHKGAIFDNVTYYPMICRGSTPLPYKPYIVGAIDTLAIPEAVKSLEGYGKGVEDTINGGYISNYVDLTAKKFYRQVRTYVFTGTEQWVQASSTGTSWRYYCKTSMLTNDANSQAVICTHLPRIQNNVSNTSEVGVMAGGPHTRYIYFFLNKEKFPDEASVKAWVADEYAKGTPVTVTYADTVVTETDISDLLSGDNFLKVEGGGAIRAVNEYGYSAPSDITYTIKTENI